MDLLKFMFALTFALALAALACTNLPWIGASLAGFLTKAAVASTIFCIPLMLFLWARNTKRALDFFGLLPK